jgi:PPOX class probable F420-dependent enzyme
VSESERIGLRAAHRSRAIVDADSVEVVSPEEALQRLRAAKVARLATITPRDRPHLVPCCFALTGQVIYSGIDGKPKSGGALQRVVNLRTRGFFTLLADHYDEDWSELWWVRVDGRGRIVDDEHERDTAVRLLTEKYPQYRDVPIPGPVLALDIEAVTSWP